MACQLPPPSAPELPASLLWKTANNSRSNNSLPPRLRSPNTPPAGSATGGETPHREIPFSRKLESLLAPAATVPTSATSTAPGPRLRPPPALRDKCCAGTTPCPAHRRHTAATELASGGIPTRSVGAPETFASRLHTPAGEIPPVRYQSDGPIACALSSENSEPPPSLLPLPMPSPGQRVAAYGFSRGK